MNYVDLNLSIDLGSDSLKIAYAYKIYSQVYYGKLTLSSDSKKINSIIPAIALYNTASSSWIFANDAEENSSSDFSFIVKIKDLLALLQFNEDTKIYSSNMKYYKYATIFPKFYFPNPPKISEKNLLDFSYKEKNDMTFDGKITPQTLCENFFKYIAQIVLEKINIMGHAQDIEFDNIKIVQIFSPNDTEPYIDEISRLITLSFGKSPLKKLNSTRALCVLADYQKKLPDGEDILVFDMGEKKISSSTTRAGSSGSKRIIVDGVDGHREPLPNGGSDFDLIVAQKLIETINNVETTGYPSRGKEGFKSNSVLHSKEYLLLQNIKTTKMIFSMAKDEYNYYNTLPISIERETHIQTMISLDMFQSWIGIKGNNGVARNIVDYIYDELSRKINKKVNTVFLAGGLIETIGLLDYINTQINKKMNRRISFRTFDLSFSQNNINYYPIEEFEDSTYSIALGGAIFLLENYKIDVCLPLTYGTWAYGSSDLKLLRVFKDENGKEMYKGDIIPQTNKLLELGVFEFNTHAPECIEGEEFYSLNITEKELANRFGRSTMYFNNQYLIVGEPKSKERTAVEEFFDIKTVSGNTNDINRSSKIVYFYNNRQIKFLDALTIYFDEGVTLDKNGKMTPFIRNNKYKNQFQYARCNYVNYSGSAFNIELSEVEFRFENMNSFEIKR